jgi:hypothetical protein
MREYVMLAVLLLCLFLRMHLYETLSLGRASPTNDIAFILFKVFF